MDYFEYANGELFAEAVPIRQIAEDFGTPVYVYSRKTLERHWHSFENALADVPHLVCYAVKANSNLAVLNLFARLGSGFDIVSVGELARVIAAGGQPSKTVFSGVGKRDDEIAAGLQAGIRCFNVESVSELERLNSIASAHGVRAPASIRVNPDVDARTHPYISTGLKDNKFGVPVSQARDLYLRAMEMRHVEISGMDCHIGSQLTSLAPFTDTVARLLTLLDDLASRGLSLKHINLGGGLGIRYHDEVPPEPAEYMSALVRQLRNRNLEILVEPGRAIAGNAGILVTRVQYLKTGEDKNFAVVDAAMNDLIRPALYQAYQEIIPVAQDGTGHAATYDVVGPVCESADFLGKQRPLTLNRGDLLAVRSAGAYGFGMSSNYNSRPRAAEILVDGERCHLARRREAVDQLFANEFTLPD